MFFDKEPLKSPYLLAILMASVKELFSFYLVVTCACDISSTWEVSGGLARTSLGAWGKSIKTRAVLVDSSDEVVVLKFRGRLRHLIHSLLLTNPSEKFRYPFFERNPRLISEQVASA
jgi:hypothetical protein